MVTVAEFTVPTSAVPSSAVFERLPGSSIEFERIVPTDDAIVPYAWVLNADIGELRRIVEALPQDRPHPNLRNAEILDVTDGDALLKLEWEPDCGGLLGAIATSDVVLISGIGTPEQWRIEVRGEDRAAVSSFQDHCVENGVPVELTSLRALTPVRSGADRVLTEAQREALALAYERGYFRTPRESTLDEIADELGITGQSLGSRLRRAINRLVAGAVAADGDAEH